MRGGFPSLEWYCKLRGTTPGADEKRAWRTWCQWLWEMCEEAERLEFATRREAA